MMSSRLKVGRGLVQICWQVATREWRPATSRNMEGNC